MEYSTEHLKDEIDSLKQRIKDIETNVSDALLLLKQQADIMDDLVNIVERARKGE